MTPAELQSLIIGTIQGLGVGVVFLLAAFIGFCVLAGFLKLRPTGRHTLVVRSLDELVGQAGHARDLPPDATLGRVDQLRSPELLEAAARKSS